MKFATTKLDFEEVFILKQFADQVRSRQVVSLNKFKDELSGGFKHSGARPDQRQISMSSTATCVGSLIGAGLWGDTENPGWMKGYAFLKTLPFWAGKAEIYARKLLSQPWTSAGLDIDNAFTVGFVVEACASLLPYLDREKFYQKNIRAQASEGNPDLVVRDRLKRAIAVLNDALFARDEQTRQVPRGAISVLGYPANAYLTQVVGRALQKLHEVDPILSPAIDFEETGVWAMREIARQISLLEAGSNLGDPLVLAYSVICAVRFRPASKRTPTDNELIRFALKVFFDHQRADGTWPQSRPLFHYKKAGSAYCYDYELLAELLDCPDIFELLFEYIPQIAKATYAIDTTKFELGDFAYGWSSNQTPHFAGPESWATACVYLFLFRIDRFLAEAIRQSVAYELEVPYTGVGQPFSSQFGETFLDCPISASDNSGSLKSEMARLLVEPLLKARKLVATGHKLPNSAKVSAILFGPPGTSKTEIVEQIANYVGWPFVTVDPSYFVRDGLDAVQAQANKIFRMLSVAEELVVLFDEFDEMVRTRTDRTEILSRFLTTAMLPKLATINKTRRILFVVATNYIDSFDIAISRPGRFDLVFQMMPPKAVEKIRSKQWTKDLRWLQSAVGGRFQLALNDLTFLETKRLVGRLSELGPIKGRKKPEGVRLFEDAITTCTLRRPNEKFPRPKAPPVVDPSDAHSTKRVRLDKEFRAKYPDHLTWAESSLEEARLIRLD